MNFNVAYIKARRKELGITQAEIAERLNISTAAYNKCENGNQRFTVDMLPILAKVLFCKIKNFYA
jgi:transcriptional regulator with XRE-family HTH domain